MRGPEAGIAWEHCRAPTFADTDWGRIAGGDDTLDRIAPSPVHALNRAVAEAHGLPYTDFAKGHGIPPLAL